MAITSRDRELLSGLGCFRVLTLKQIQRNYFAGAARANVQRRLGTLRKQNLVRGFAFGDRGEFAWTLTAKGAVAVSRPEHVFRRPPNRNTLPHDLAVANVGLRLKRMGLLHEWVSAYEIETRTNRFQSNRSHVPDAVFRLKLGSQLVGPIGLEIEHSTKTRRRIEKVLECYRYDVKATDLWFVWRHPWMGKALREFSGWPNPRVWIACRSLSESPELRFDGKAGTLLDIEAMAVYPQKTPDTGLETSGGSENFPAHADDLALSHSEIERLRVRRTSNSAGLITRDHSTYTLGRVVTAGPLENGVRRNGKVESAREYEEGGSGNSGSMTGGIKGLESGVLK